MNTRIPGRGGLPALGAQDLHPNWQTTLPRASLPTKKFEQGCRLHLSRCFTRTRPGRSKWLILAESETAPKPLRYGAGAVRDIPVFPLGLVAFPTTEVPLNIFEARYRVLFNTLLAGSEGVNEDLVNEEKPWAGTRLFGMCYVNDQRGMATVGTTLHISKHVTSADGRMLVVNRGVETFKVLQVLEQRPVMVCRVEIQLDDDDKSQEIEDLSKESIQIFRGFIERNVRMSKHEVDGLDVAALSKLVKANDIPFALPAWQCRIYKSDCCAVLHRPTAKPEVGLDERMEGMSPREVSYTLAQIFARNTYFQQVLLEEKSLKMRLEHVKDVLNQMSNMLSARWAVESAFQPNESESQDKSVKDDPPEEGSQSRPTGPD